MGIVDAIQYVGLAVGAASGVAAALRPIVRRTPTDTDDKWLRRAARALSAVESVVDRLALNPRAGRD